MIGQRKKLEKRQMLDFDWSTQIPKEECKKKSDPTHAPDLQGWHSTNRDEFSCHVSQLSIMKNMNDSVIIEVF